MSCLPLSSKGYDTGLSIRGLGFESPQGYQEVIVKDTRNTEPYIGLDFNQFEKIITLCPDIQWRVVAKDGEGGAVSADLQAYRLNLIVNNNIITKAWWG